MTAEYTTLAEGFFQNKFDGIIRIELEAQEDAIWVDGRQDTPLISVVAPENVASDFCLWRTSRETFKRIALPGVRQLEAAYISGRLSISGDMAVMARLNTGE